MRQNKKKWFSLLLVVSLFAIFLTSCAETPSCNPGTSSCGTFEACCTSTDCYYTYLGKRYNCNGTNCDEVAKKLTSIMCSSSKKSGIGSVVQTQQTLLAKLPCK